MAVNCECGRSATLVGGDMIYPHRSDLFAKKFWLCAHCGAYVGCHPAAKSNGKGGQGDGTVPLGRLADAELRRWKSTVHAQFDPMWKDGSMSRSAAYKWLAEQLNIPLEDCHIGMFDTDTCRRAAHACRNAAKERA